MLRTNRTGVVGICLLLVACGSSDDGPLHRSGGVGAGARSDDAGDATASASGGAAPSAGGASAGAPTGNGLGTAGSATAGRSTGAGGVAPGNGGRAVTDAGTPPRDDADTGPAEPDASAGGGGAAGCATRSVWYADTDGDGFGTVAIAVVGCTEPAAKGWVTNADDCVDTDARVHPGQLTYFGESYKAAGDTDSFDYDCSGEETPDPSQHTAPASCALLSLGTCGGSGYVPTTRAGRGVSALCGSVQTTTCTPALVLCQAVTATVTDAFRCH